MADKLGMLVTVGADIKPLTKGLTDAKKELAATAAVAAKTDSSLGKLGGGANQATNAMTNLGRVVQDAPFGFIGIANNINPLLESFQRLKIETGSTKGAISALGSSLIGGGGLGLAISVATSLLTVFAMNGMFKAGDAAEKAKDKVKTFSEVLGELAAGLAKEASETAGLISILNNENETRNRKLSAIKELQKIQPEIFKGLKLEGDAVKGLDIAYQAYLVNLKSVLAAKIIQAQIEAKVTELLKLQGAENTKQEQEQIDKLKNLIDQNEVLSGIKKNLQDTKLGGGFLTDKQSAARIAALNEQLKGLFDKLTEFSKNIKIDEIKITPKKIKVEVEEAAKRSSLEVQSEIQTALSRISGSTLSPTLVLTPKISIKVTPAEQKKVLDNIQALFNAENIQAIMDRTFNSAVSNLADSFANVLAGGKNAFSNLFDGLASTFAAGIKEIGRYLVQTYLLIGTIQKIKFSNPAVGVAVGFALQVLGGLIQSKINKTKAFATGVRNFDGGVALVGERGPELVNLPRGAGVVPNNEMNAYGGGGNQVFIPAVSLRGSDLVIAFNRASQSMSRNS